MVLENNLTEYRETLMKFREHRIVPDCEVFFTPSIPQTSDELLNRCCIFLDNNEYNGDSRSHGTGGIVHSYIIFSGGIHFPEDPDSREEYFNSSVYEESITYLRMRGGSLSFYNPNLDNFTFYDLVREIDGNNLFKEWLESYVHPSSRSYDPSSE